MKIFAETDRLILRELLPSDAEGMYALDADPEVHRYLGHQPIEDRQQAMAAIQNVRRQYEEEGVGRWAMEEKATGSLVGWTGLKLVKTPMNGYVNYHDLGYRLRREYWGRGLAIESAWPALAYGFEQLGLATIYAAAHVDNIGSNRVLQKLGFQRKNAFYYQDLPCHWYAITREAFLDSD